MNNALNTLLDPFLRMPEEEQNEHYLAVYPGCFSLFADMFADGKFHVAFRDQCSLASGDRRKD